MGKRPPPDPVAENPASMMLPTFGKRVYASEQGWSFTILDSFEHSVPILNAWIIGSSWQDCCDEYRRLIGWDCDTGDIQEGGIFFPSHLPFSFFANVSQVSQGPSTLVHQSHTQLTKTTDIIIKRVAWLLKSDSLPSYLSISRLKSSVSQRQMELNHLSDR